MYEIEKFGCLGILEHFVTNQCIVYLFNKVPAYPVSKHVWGPYTPCAQRVLIILLFQFFLLTLTTRSN